MQNRRDFIAATAGLSAVSLAGCSGLLGGGSETSGRSYRNLVVETDERPLRVSARKFSELAAVEDFSGVGAQEQTLGVSPEDIEYVANVSAGQSSGSGYGIVFGPFEFESLQSQLSGGGEEAGVEEIEEINGFRTLELARPELENVYYGINETLVVGFSREWYENGTRMAGGGESTIFDVNDDVDTLADVIGNPSVSRLALGPEELQTDPTGNAVAGAGGIDVGDSESDVTSAVMYETEGEASGNESAVADSVAQTYSGIESTETEVDGRIVIVRGTSPTSDL